MALQLETQINTPQGFIIENGYMRLSVLDKQDGTMLSVKTYLYLNETSYVDGLLDILGVIDIDVEVPYSRLSNGVDSLDYAHDYIIDYLLNAMGIVATKDLD